MSRPTHPPLFSLPALSYAGLEKGFRLFFENNRFIPTIPQRESAEPADTAVIRAIK